jgi:hypothetical protein
MYLKQPKESTDPRIRSLLQKAVRRGYTDLVKNTANYLYQNGDRTWLRSRTVVITFEECWPLAENLELTKEPESKIESLLRITESIKQKDAASLGALSYAYHEGDHSMLDLVSDVWAIRVVSEALNKPQAFYDWVVTTCQSNSGFKIIESSRSYLAAATWGWDKACILAGAFLACTGNIPVFSKTPSSPTTEFPYWIALDKHTPQGKETLHLLASELNINYRHLIWSGFYFESAKVNTLDNSIWWEIEKKWRLRKAGLTIDAGAALWESVRMFIANRLENDANELRIIIESPKDIQGKLF